MFGSIRFFAISTSMIISNENNQSFDSRRTLNRSDARKVYDTFAETGHAGGKDASSGYGGPAVSALLEMADFGSARNVLDFGCGQGKLASLVLTNRADRLSAAAEGEDPNKNGIPFHWKGIDQSPNMIKKFQEECVDKFGKDICDVELIANGDPRNLMRSYEANSVDRFVSTYCLDLLSEDDMYGVLDLAEQCLDKERGLLLLSGITWGYSAGSLKVFAMTAVWELLYIIRRKKVGGCRPQALRPYLESRGWRIEKMVKTMPSGFPWMVSEVIAARPPLPCL